jgi:chemotaxis regulatin CheY-phosphate phosphatase CheZ
MPSQIDYSQYNNVISRLKNALSIVAGPNGEYNPGVGSQLQLLTVSLGDDFQNLKAKLSEIAAYYAAQSSSREPIIREKIQDIINELENDIVDLILSFQTQAAANNINFNNDQLKYLFRDE